MATIPAAGYISDPSRNEGETKTTLESLVACVRHVPWSGQVELTNTISIGVITPAGSGGVIVVDTEAATSSDDLTTITQTNYPDGSFLLVRNANAARTVVVKHGTGNIQLKRNADMVLDDTAKWVLFRRKDSLWYEIFRGPNRLTTEVLTKSATFTINKQDIGKAFVCTSSYTINLSSAASLGNGFIFGVRNVGTGTLVVDANSSELIDGATVLSIPPGWSFQFLCTGSAWITTDSTGPQTTENPVINGIMEVWQRGSSIAVSISGGSYTYCADKWNIHVLGAARSLTVNRSTDVPTLANAGVCFNFSLEVDCTTAYAAPASTDLVTLRQGFEMGAFRHLNQRQLTVSFWVRSSKTGTHSVVMSSATLTRCYVATYTISVADTWEYKTITIAASPSAIIGSLQQTVLFNLEWTLQAGSSFVTSSTNQWLTTTGSGLRGATGTANTLDNTSNLFRITGVKIELGSIATPYDVSSFEEDYLRCLRYYQKSFAYATTPAYSVGSNTGEWIFPQTVGASTVFNTAWVPYILPMANAPFQILWNPNGGTNQVRNRNTSTDCTSSSGNSNVSLHGFVLQATTPGGSAIGQTLAVHWESQVS